MTAEQPSVEARLNEEAQALWHISFTGDRPDLDQQEIDALATLLRDAAAALEASERRCPVCLSDEWELEYDYSDEGEIEQERCQKCMWPPTYPETVEQWRRGYFISPYLKELEEGLAAAEARAQKAEAEAARSEKYAEDRDLFAQRAEAVVEAARETHANYWKLGASQDWTEYHEARKRLGSALTAALEARRWNDSLLRDAIRELRDPNGLSREDIAGSLERDMKNV